MKFSERIGMTKVREKLQVASIDERLENRLWNTIMEVFFLGLKNKRLHNTTANENDVYFILWKEFFVKRTDEIPFSSRNTVDIKAVLGFIKNWFFESQWYEKYDFIECLIEIDSIGFNTDFSKYCNKALKTEMAGYRIVDECIVQITSEEEIVEIEEALNGSSKWSSVNTHLKTALEYFSNRENPDYRNSIKESISAVESLCMIIVENNKATLGQALSIIEKEFQIHRALKSAFSALYGYTSDSGGIRHSLLEDDIPVNFEDAKFMLVSCSAFINYLKVKVEE